MKKYIFTALALLSLVACHESLEDKAAHEANEFTKKECPQSLGEGITIDSMRFERQNRTIHYFFTISGKADTTAIDKSSSRQGLLKSIKGDMNTRKYKEEGFNFAYTYFSKKHKGLVLIDYKFTPKDYKDARK